MKNATRVAHLLAFLRQEKYPAIDTDAQERRSQLDAFLFEIFSGLVGESGMAVKKP
ncbi:hypothetical protein [Microbulbifer magnicolonia]|uniref:hypothetical protein n=1 Tax=Microbulbifer magnicolonia TaxID=3109744 RepID=UPI002B4053CD|nr:hypothetical protein [Microbulbifer sp. GG15]